VKPKYAKVRTLRFRVSSAEELKIMARLPAGTEFSDWIRGLALGEETKRVSAVALAEYNTGRELAYLAASVDALAQEVAAAKPESLVEWLVVLYRIREAAIDLARPHKGIGTLSGTQTASETRSDFQ
jgi:hypothetical protein